MDLSLLATLKDKLVQEKQLIEVQKYFLDHFGEVPGFIGLGERTDHPFLEQLLAQIGAQMFGRPVPVTDVLLTRLAAHDFVHGACTLGGMLAAVLYFEDIHVGLVTVAWTLAPPETKFARFTARPLPQVNPKPSVN
jgi:hypothetical protein